MILIESGRVLTETGFVEADVLVDGSQIKAIGSHLDTAGAETVVDAHGCVVGPGFVDVHVHFREPGQTWKEDMATGSAAAAAGGYTAVVIMPNTDPALDTVDLVEMAVDRGRSVGLVEVFVAAALTVGRHGEVLTDFENLHAAGVRIFTDDGDSIASRPLMVEIMKRIRHLDGAVVSQHAEDHSRTRDGHMHEGAVSAQLGIVGLASSAESDIVTRDLEITRETGSAYHCQHVSTKETVDLLRSAKAEGLPVTAEVTPHHLSFTDEDVRDIGTNLKMYPPVRTDQDRRALREALIDGTIDMVATDHAPHSVEEKNTAFEQAPRGVIGLETAAAVCNELVEDPERFFTVMSIAPAGLAGMERQGHRLGEGSPANLVVFDPEARWRPTRFVSKAQNSPYGGRELKGKVRATIYEGTVTHMEAVQID